MIDKNKKAIIKFASYKLLSIIKTEEFFSENEMLNLRKITRDNLERKIRQRNFMQD